MLKILFDQNMTKHLRRLLAGHTVITAEEMLWDGLRNGYLLRAADAEGFDVLITGDKKMYEQQKHLDRRIALLVLIPNRWAVIKENGPAIFDALRRIKPGGHEELVLMQDGLPAPAKAGGKRR